MLVDEANFSERARNEKIAESAEPVRLGVNRLVSASEPGERVSRPLQLPPAQPPSQLNDISLDSDIPHLFGVPG